MDLLSTLEEGCCSSTGVRKFETPELRMTEVDLSGVLCACVNRGCERAFLRVRAEARHGTNRVAVHRWVQALPDLHRHFHARRRVVHDHREVGAVEGGVGLTSLGAIGTDASCVDVDVNACTVVRLSRETYQKRTSQVKIRFHNIMLIQNPV